MPPQEPKRQMTIAPEHPTVLRQRAKTSVCDRRLAVIDLGSNSFRMVVFKRNADHTWEREHDLSRAVRIGEGLGRNGRLRGAAIERGLQALREFVAVCDSHPSTEMAIDAVATSAVRDAENGEELLELARERVGVQVRILTREQEARYGYLAAVNSTALTDGCVLDLGGGSLQLVHVIRRLPREMRSWRLGAVRMTERFLDSPGPAQPAQLRALREHAQRKLARAPWLSSAGPELVGLGGTVRSLAMAAEHAEGLPAEDVQGFAIRADALDDLIERLARLPAAERASVPGIKPSRADIVLPGAVVIREVMRVGGFNTLTVTGAGLREGIFFERQLAQRRLGELLVPQGGTSRRLAVSG